MSSVKNKMMLSIDRTMAVFAITAAVGAVAGAVVGGIVAAQNGGNVWARIGIGAAAGALIGTGVGMAAGVALAGSITTSTSAVATCTAATDSAMVVDVSGAASVIRGKKAGASVVVDFKNDNVNFYTHTGYVTCNSMGLSASYSVVWSIIIQNRRIMPVLLQMSMEGL